MSRRGATLVVVVALILAGCSSVPADRASQDTPEAPPYGQELRNETALYERTGTTLEVAESYTIDSSERVKRGSRTVRTDRTLSRQNLSVGRSLIQQEHPDSTYVIYTDTETEVEPGYRYTRVTYPPGENGRNRSSRERYGGNLIEPTEISPGAPATAVLATETLHYNGTATVGGEQTYRYVVRNDSGSHVGYSHYTGETHIETYRLEVFVRPDGSLALARLTMRVSAAGRPYVVVHRTRTRDLGSTTVTPPPWIEETEIRP